MKQYEYAGRIYTVTTCTKEDIPSHVERVLSYWQECDVDISEQIKALEDAVQSNTALKVINDLGETESAIYFKKLKAHDVQSNLLFLNNKRMFAILCYHLRVVTSLRAIYFLPHTKDYIPFEFVVDDYSIRLFHSHNRPLEINLFSKKGQMLYEDHFLRHNIQAL